MQVVINISEEDYEGLKRKDKFNDMHLNYYEKLIANGVPLPKGHGRLVDADEFHHTLEDMPIRDNDKWFNWLQKACNRLAEAPTIIEADKVESEE
jgi:hypothetical protein